MDRERMTIMSNAYREAESIRGTADAEAARLYADAYNRNRSFFDFWRAIESYRNTIPALEKIVTTDMDYFRYLYSIQGR
jgi:membrane protease subunit HflC